VNYANIFYDDTVNGEGFRTSLFVSGCSKNPPCMECWSPEARSFYYGKVFTESTKANIIYSLRNPYVKGLSILGGEPMDNLEDGTLLDLVKTVRALYPDKTIFCWTGYTYEDLIKEPMKLEFISQLDMLRDGEYIPELRNVTQYLNGSTNQRIIMIKDVL